MKYITKILLLAGVTLMWVSCQKEHDETITPDPPVIITPTYPTFDTPNWSVSNVSSYEYNMTVAIVLPDSLKSEEKASDKLAIFTNNECIGVGERIELSPGNNVWMAMVYGDNYTDALSFKYYSSKTKHMYNSEKKFSFIIDGSIGTIDVPETIGMKIVTK